MKGVCVAKINGEVQLLSATVTRHNDDGTCDANVEFPDDTLGSLWRNGGTVEFFAVSTPPTKEDSREGGSS